MAEEEVLDSRIKDELDALNSASSSINKLENEVQKARASFKQLKEDCTSQLMACARQVGKNHIHKSNDYYLLLNQLIKVQAEMQKSTQKFQKANSLYKAALETVSLAEEKLEDKIVFDGAWQEMLNHANMRFNEAEKDKRACELEHGRWSKQYESYKRTLSNIHRSNAKSINKSKSFYEMKRKFELKLQAERQNVEDLQLALVCSKQKYRMTLDNLQCISEDLHAQRRSPGVGCESDATSELSDNLTFNFDLISDTTSQVSYGDLEDFELHTDLSPTSQDTSFFSKMSSKFNRSTSLGNLGDRHKLSQLTQNFLTSYEHPSDHMASNTAYNLPNTSHNTMFKDTNTSFHTPVTSHNQTNLSLHTPSPSTTSNFTPLHDASFKVINSMKNDVPFPTVTRPLIALHDRHPTTSNHSNNDYVNRLDQLSVSDLCKKPQASKSLKVADKHAPVLHPLNCVENPYFDRGSKRDRSDVKSEKGTSNKEQVFNHSHLSLSTSTGVEEDLNKSQYNNENFKVNSSIKVEDKNNKSISKSIVLSSHSLQQGANRDSNLRPSDQKTEIFKSSAFLKINPK